MRELTRRTWLDDYAMMEVGEDVAEEVVPVVSSSEHAVRFVVHIHTDWAGQHFRRSCHLYPTYSSSFRC